MCDLLECVECDGLAEETLHTQKVHAPIHSSEQPCGWGNSLRNYDTYVRSIKMAAFAIEISIKMAAFAIEIKY